MKTLNRTLSLVLVLVMVLGLFGIASAAKLGDFEDKGEITYTEAVDYLTAAGVVAGDTATTINPQGELTREQAAKLIAYAMLGQVAADNLRATSDPFTDVAASRWSAGYIAYCQKQGVINGLGDGTFAPEDKVTGYQYAKMLLSAMGFGVNDEFTGNGWELETARLALAYGIFAGNTKGASNEPANREEAFLYTFNTLSSLCAVSYNKNLGVYYVPGSNAIQTNPTSATIAAAEAANDISKDTRKDTLGAVRFNMLKAVTSDGAYGQGRHVWQQSGAIVTGKYNNGAVKVLATSANGTPFAKLTDDSKATYIGFSPDNSATTKYYYNGAEKTVAGDIATATATAATKGVIVSFIDTDNDGKYNTVSIVNDTVREVTAAITVKTVGSVTTVTVPGIAGLQDINIDNVDGYEGLEKGDWVTYHVNAGYYTITKCEEVTGRIYGYNVQGGKLNFNGANVDVSELSGSDTVTSIEADGYVGVDGVTAYKDASGYIVKVIASETVATLNNILFLKSGQEVGYAKQGEIVLADGTKSVVNISTIDNVEPIISGGNFTPALVEKFYSFTKNAAGAYSLKSLSGTVYPQGTSTASDIVSGKASYLSGSDTVATSKTVFVYENSGKYTLHTGINNVPGYTRGSGTVAFLNDKDGYARFVVAYDGTPAAGNSSDYVFLTLPASVNALDVNNPYYIFSNTVINGEIKDVDATYGLTTEVDGTTDLALGRLYAVKGYDNGKVDALDSTDGRIYPFAAGGMCNEFDLNGSTLKTLVNGTTTNAVSLASDCKVFLYDATKATPTIESITAAELPGLAKRTYQVQALTKSTTETDTIVQLFVTMVPDNAQTGLSALSTTITSGSAVSLTPTFATTTLNYTVSVITADASKAINISATATAAAFGATVEYSTDGTTYTSNLSATTATSGSSQDVFVRVNFGAASTTYKITFTTA